MGIVRKDDSPDHDRVRAHGAPNAKTLPAQLLHRIRLAVNGSKLSKT
jgi:hypothetical protein